ncbi:hypothetical protein Gpo141_00011530 [Globisporangium polare]
MSAATTSARRTINALAAFESCGLVKPWQFQSRPLGPDDVEVKISQCGVCSTDVHMIDSGWGPSEYPCVVCSHEIVGEVTLVGPEVTHLAVGDRVGVGAQVFACLNKDKSRPHCVECADGADTYCSRTLWTYASKYDDGEVTRVTVFTPLKQGGIKADDRVGVVGIGGLGHLAIQFINAMSAIPVAFSRSANKEKDIRALGAKEFFNLNMLLITADATNMPYNLYLSLLKPRGTCVMLAVPNDEVKYLPFFLISRGIKFIGSGIGSIVDVKDMLALAAEKNVRPIIQKLPMAQANEGLQMVRDGTVRYRVVLEN